MRENKREKRRKEIDKLNFCKKGLTGKTKLCIINDVRKWYYTLSHKKSECFPVKLPFSYDLEESRLRSNISKVEWRFSDVYFYGKCKHRRA